MVSMGHAFAPITVLSSAGTRVSPVADAAASGADAFALEDVEHAWIHPIIVAINLHLHASSSIS